MLAVMYPSLFKGVGGPSLSSIERIGVLGHSWVRSSVTEWGATVGGVRATAKGWPFHAGMLSGRKFWVDPFACEGYSGFRTDQIQAAILPAGSMTSYGPTGQKVSVPYGIRSTGVKRAMVCALINDLTYEGGLQGTTTPTTTAAITRLRSLWAAVRSFGIEPVNISIGPRNDSYSGAIPAWFAAEAAAAAADGVQNIDILTPCSNNGMTWKLGYDWANGVEDPTFLHPGADGCWLGIAPAIAAAITSTRTQCPTLTTATQATLVRGAQSVAVSVISTGWDGLFGSASNWPARFSTGGTPTRSVSSGGIAQVGNRFQVACAPQATNFQTDFVSPTLTGLTIGQRYGVLLRVKFDAGAARPTTGNLADVFALTIEDTSFNAIGGFTSGGSDSYSVAGASIPEADYYVEFVATATSHRFRADQVTRTTSTGTLLHMAQAGALVAV